MNRRDVILAQLADERERQIELGWTVDHDRRQGRDHLLELAAMRLVSCADDPELLEAAALIMAALEVEL